MAVETVEQATMNRPWSSNQEYRGIRCPRRLRNVSIDRLNLCGPSWLLVFNSFPQTKRDMAAL